MVLEIPRVPAQDMTAERFDREFYATESPVVVTGCAVDSGVTVDHLRGTYMDPDTRDFGWYDSPLPSASGDTAITVPGLVTDVLARTDVAVRPLPMRVWLQPNGHKSLFHYDGNSLCGFNLQVKGHKSWTLISPDSGLRPAPFNFVMLVDNEFVPDDAAYDVYRFETGPGDMVFLPRYWVHGVETLADVNINLNWVWTPTYPNPSSELGTREIELLRLRQIAPVFDLIMGDSASSYGGSGESIVDAYADSVSRRQAFARLGRELVQLPRMLFKLPSILGEIKMFSKNNFNVESSSDGDEPIVDLRETPVIDLRAGDDARAGSTRSADVSQRDRSE